jgi:DNA-binding Xre family transcriptional regulator
MYGMWMRLRFPELMAARGWNPYQLSKASGRRISLTTAYRLDESDGRFDKVTAKLLEELCRVFAVTPGELFETDAEEAARHATERPARKRPAK